MSAVNILVHRDVVSVLTDGAVYDDRAIFQHAAPKVFSLPHLNCAVAFRGGALAPLLANVLAGASGYADLKSRAFELLRDAISTAQHVTRSAFGGNFQVFVAGFFEGRPDAYTVITKPEGSLPAWTPIPIPEQSFTPFEVDGPIHADVWDILGGRSACDLDPRVDGLRIVEAQRRHKVALPDGWRAHIVGGFCQLTSVRSDSITTEIIRRWPDKPGERIKPFARIYEGTGETPCAGAARKGGTPRRG
jgi:hypothetical protein